MGQVFSGMVFSGGGCIVRWSFSDVRAGHFWLRVGCEWGGGGILWGGFIWGLDSIGRRGFSHSGVFVRSGSLWYGGCSLGKCIVWNFSVVEEWGFSHSVILFLSVFSSQLLNFVLSGDVLFWSSLSSSHDFLESV